MLMKRISSCIILLICISSAFAQQTATRSPQNTTESELPVEYASVKIKPEFRGETWAFYISHNLKYPEEALKNKISGKVYVSFIIEKNGSITNVQVIQGLGSGLDEEAIRVIKNSPRWKPGYQAKKDPVRVACVMPISFTPNIQ
jgi:TonB family protein